MRLIPPLLRRSSWLPLGAALLLAACQGGKTEGVERTVGFPAPGKDVVVSQALQVMRAEGFSVDMQESDLEKGILVSLWRNDLQPFSHLGVRDQATLTVREVPGHKDYYVVEANVLRQHNDNQVEPSNVIRADWGGDERVPELERVLVAKVERYFRTPDVSPRFREAYGLPPSDARVLENPELTPKKR